MVTRSGTNQFRGSVFWQNRNSALSANSWSNNFNGVNKDYRNANQFGGRIGGPIVKNKTFFFFLWEGQRYVTKHQFIGSVLTAEARQGTFRFFPGVQNGNFFSNNPVVDRFGNPVTPQGAQGSLQSVSVFGRDPNRMGADASSWAQYLISKMPMPNDFTAGDGLNTAGHRWLRRVQGQDTSVGDGQDTNRNQTNVRIDHNFNSRHKLSFSATREHDWSMTTQTGISAWPGGYDGLVKRDPHFYQAGLTSTVSPTVLNEFRFGTRRNKHFAWNAIQRPDAYGEEARSHLPTKNGELFLPSHILFNQNLFFPGGQTRGQTSPIYSFTDTLSWTRGKHAFKAGFEARLSASRGFNFGDDPKLLFPSVTIGQSGPQVAGISTIPGLVGGNITLAQNLLLDLSGSVSNVSRTFYIQKPTDREYTGLVQVPRDNHQNEWGTFFKDDWKIRPDLTLNLGVRYDYYGVPYESNGLMAMPIGGNKALYGITAGALTQLQFAGKHSPNPDALWYKNDWNNIAPAVGFSWSLPWFGKDKTVLRAGYGMSYQGAANYNAGWNYSNPNASSYGQNFTRLGLGARYFNLSNIPIPVPPPGPGIVPLATEPLTVRTSSLRASDENRVVPYIQNWNLEIQRALASNLTLEARYIASKGTKLLAGIPLNDVDIFSNKFLEAYNITRAGGNAAMFDQMLNGLNLGLGTINGTTVTGSASLRQNTQTRGFLANGDVGQLASFINTNSTITGVGGGLLRNSGLFPENFVVNPQFASVRLDSNPANSTYHSMQLQVTKRLSSGFTNQTSYTWAKTLGEASDDGAATYFDPKNRSLNKTLLDFHRTHAFLSNGTFELPFGPGRPYLNSAPGFITRLVEQWQLGGIFSWTSGAPTTITATSSTFTQATGNMPVILASFPKNAGKITPDSSGGTYFPGFRQIRRSGEGQCDDAAESAEPVQQPGDCGFPGKSRSGEPVPWTAGYVGPAMDRRTGPDRPGRQSGQTRENRRNQVVRSPRRRHQSLEHPALELCHRRHGHQQSQFRAHQRRRSHRFVCSGGHHYGRAPVHAERPIQFLKKSIHLKGRSGTCSKRRRFLQSAGIAGAAPAFGAIAGAQLAGPQNLKVESDVAFGKGGEMDLRLDIYHPPAGTEKKMAVIHLHGGGFAGGSKAGVASSSRAFTGLGYISIASQYRLTGQGRWPAQIEDVKAAIRWTRANASRLNIEPDRIAIAGYSAGGLMALFAAGTQDRKEFDGNGGNPGVSTKLSACVAFYPAVSANAGLLPEGSDHAAIDAASAASTISPSFAPTIFLHGVADTTIRPESSLAFFEKLRAAGVKVDLHFFQGAPHAYEVNNPDAALVSAQIANLFFERLVINPREYPPFGAGRGGGRGGRGERGGQRQ